MTLEVWSEGVGPTDEFQSSSGARSESPSFLVSSLPVRTRRWGKLQSRGRKKNTNNNGGSLFFYVFPLFALCAFFTSSSTFFGGSRPAGKKGGLGQKPQLNFTSLDSSLCLLLLSSSLTRNLIAVWNASSLQHIPRGMRGESGGKLFPLLLPRNEKN